MEEESKKMLEEAQNEKAEAEKKEAERRDRIERVLKFVFLKNKLNICSYSSTI